MIIKTQYKDAIMNSHDIKIFSFFSGAGFLDLGFEKKRYDIVLVNEFFEPFINAYAYSRKQMNMESPTYGYCNNDINEYLNIRKDELSNYINKQKENGLIGFIGGPPCPDFSIGGKNAGRHGDNGKLSLSYIQLIIQMLPDFFVFENVKGLWKTKRHREFFEDLKKMLYLNGYITTERLINAIEYGTPQDRERIILIGFRKGLIPYKLVDNNSNKDFPWEQFIKYNKKSLNRIDWPKTDKFQENSIISCPIGIIEELTVEFWFRKNSVYTHPNHLDFFQPRRGLEKMKNIEEGDDSRKSYKRLHRWRFSPTVAYGNNEVHLHPYIARRISASEALALQSLPESFILPPEMNLTNKFKTIGNGVPFLAADGIAKTLIKFLEDIS